MYYTGKEKRIYTFTVCFAMEFLMAFYNAFFHTDAFLDEAFILACLEFIPAFIVGVCCEWLIIAKVAKKVALYLHAKHFKNRDIIHINELMISIGMMIVISLFGLIYHYKGYDDPLLLLFCMDFFKNAIIGIPLFMFAISPLTRKWIDHFNRKQKG